MANCLVVQHLEVESAYAIGDALAAAGVALEVARTFAGDTVPADASGLDALVVMGGPMSAASDDGFPTRRAEIALLADARRAGIPTLGVCLGAQLLAVAAGSRAFPGERGPEIGWGPVTLGSECADDPLFAGLPGELTVLHWHGDTFDLPEGSRHLIGSATYANQAFRLGEAAWGLQFHLEVTEAAVESFIAAFGTDATSSGGGPSTIAAATPAAVAELAGARTLVLDRFSALVVARATEGELVDAD